MTTTSGQLNTIVELPDAPDIPGLGFRRFRDESDYLHMATVFNDCMKADGIERFRTAEEMPKGFAIQTQFDPYRDILLAEVNNRVVGYGCARWFEEESGNLIYNSLGCVMPQWRRRGIGRAILHHNQAHLREIAAEHSQDQPHLFEAVAAKPQVEATGLLLSEGYKPEVYFADMVRPDLEDIPDLPMPEGLEVRPVRPEHYRALWDASEEANRDHWGYVPATEEDYQRWLSHPTIFQPELWCVAWDGDQVAGQVRAFINHGENKAYNRKRGYAEFISVRRPWRRRGLARALLAKSLRVLKAHGMTEATLGVHTDNPNGAFRLYKSLGFRQILLEVLYQKPMK